MYIPKKILAVTSIYDIEKVLFNTLLFLTQLAFIIKSLPWKRICFSYLYAIIVLCLFPLEVRYIYLHQ